MSSCRRLAGLFSGAHQLMLRWFQHDIDEHLLADAEHWKGAGTHPSIQRVIPLLRPNSDVAKVMRVSASLSVLARAAAKYIMRPTYLVQDDGIDYKLAALARQNVEQEMYVRATLLMVLPEQQKERGRKGIQMVAKEVENAVGGWVPEEGRHGFSSELKSALERMADNWSHIQGLAENVRPHWDTTYGEDWRPLPALLSADPAETTGTQAPQKGAKGRGKQAASKPEAAGQKQPPPPPVGPVEVPIWPSFAYWGAGGEKPLYPGFGLSQSQLASAEEVSRRTARKTAREERPATPVAKRGPSFLLAGASNGASAGPSVASDDSGSA